ncbi:hypothetical protein E2C01_023142 [Portunus trituberculatus]|uniref:Uncharacterized protein n=1 Tax=Portunus trituberculatus TaxID=210409 RepID=A0A5B7E778_PORTR|nr:hypothetical protein [Portunus trituberculatus]
MDSRGVREQQPAVVWSCTSAGVVVQRTTTCPNFPGSSVRNEHQPDCGVGVTSVLLAHASGCLCSLGPNQRVVMVFLRAVLMLWWWRGGGSEGWVVVVVVKVVGLMALVMAMVMVVLMGGNSGEGGADVRCGWW